MSVRQVIAALVTLAFGVGLAASAHQTSEIQKETIIRDLIAEVGIARQPLPPGKHGVELSTQGNVLNGDDVRAELDSNGKAVAVGDRAAITAIEFRNDRILFQINGGPQKAHWYQHVQIGMGGGTAPLSPSQSTRHGSLITLEFDSKLPALTSVAVRKYLSPLIDWDPPAKATVMVQPLPPTVKAAIDSHHVLVGMDSDMVIAALGRTGNRVRETGPTGQEYEDWVYGDPPATTFVRLIADHVVQVTTYKPDGTEVVDSTPDPALAKLAAVRAAQAAPLPAPGSTPASAPAADQAPPTLRRTGDAAPTTRPGTSPPAPIMIPDSPNVGMPPATLPPGPPGSNSGCCTLR